MYKDMNAIYSMGAKLYEGKLRVEKAHFSWW